MEDNFLPDDQLDALFQKAANGQRHSFNETAWQTMSARLDSQAFVPIAQQTNWQKPLWLFLLCLMPIAWQITEKPVVQIAIAGGTQEKLAAKIAFAQPEKTNFINEEKTKSTLEKKYNQIQSTDNQKISSLIKTRKSNLVSDVGVENIKSVAIGLQIENSQLETNEVNTVNENEIINSAETKAIYHALANKNINLSASHFVSPVIESLEKPNQTPTKLSVIDARPVVSMRILASSDFNSVGLNGGFKNLGNSIGVVFEYEFKKRWKLQTGFIKTDKSYTTPLENYSLPESATWVMGIKPAEVEAQCTILDIPLNIRFDAHRQGKHDFFLTTGLSSYLMVSENYHYDYSPNYGYMLKGNLLQDRRMYRSSDYLFSTFNFSVGYEKQLKNGFSFQLEPYLKTPLRGAGWGGINLYSTGLIISLKHSF